MRLRFLSLILFALLSWPLGWVSEARVHVQNLGGSIASVAQLPGARFVRWVEARGLSLGEQERVESYLSRRCGLLGSPHLTGYGQVVEELTVSGGVTNLSKVYTVGMGLVSQRVISGSVVSFYGTDGHGSVRFLTRTNGLVTDTYTFDAFGTLIAGTITTSNNYLYCGEQWDADLGRYFLRARYYEPGLGRFTTMDTFEGNPNDPLSLHKYLYCHAIPVNNTDPSGQWTLADVQVAVATWGVLATTVAYRTAPYINRATVLLFEASTGNTVFLGGGGAAVALRAGTKMGGVGWATWQSIGNLLKGLGSKIGTYKELAKTLERTGAQANHLNQAAAFPKIPYDEGVAAAVQGGTNLKGSAHHLFHDSLEAFWRQFRKNGGVLAASVRKRGKACGLGFRRGFCATR